MDIITTRNHQQKNTFLFICLFALIIGFRIFLILDVPKQYLMAPHDDLFYAKAATALLDGEWLGEYNANTLIKVPFYAVFLALSASTGLPLFFNETAFLLIGGIVSFYSLEPVIANRWKRLLIFTLLVYCPAGIFTEWTLRVYREFVYYSLSLLVVSFAIGLFLRLSSSNKKLIGWGIGTGLSLGAFLLTREEGVWIYPSLALLWICGVVVILKKTVSQKWLKVSLFLTPLLLAYIQILTVSFVNETKYGFWGISDQLSPDYVRIIGNLSRIKTQTTWYPYVQIPRQALQKAYQASTMMKALQPELDRNMDSWTYFSEQGFEAKPLWYTSQFSNHATEVGAGHFTWALRGALEAKGYFSSQGRYPSTYLRELADELQDACDSRLLDCRPPQNIPLVGSLDQRHLPLITKMFIYQARLLLKLSIIRIPDLNVETWQQIVDPPADFAFYDRVTNNSVIHSQELGAQSAKVEQQSNKLAIRHKFSQQVHSLYRLMTPFLFLLSVFCMVGIMGISITQKTFDLLNIVTILIFLVSLAFTRFLVLVIIDATTTASGVYYGASIYLFLYLFISISLIIFSEKFPVIKALVKNHLNK